MVYDETDNKSTKMVITSEDFNVLIRKHIAPMKLASLDAFCNKSNGQNVDNSVFAHHYS